MMRLGAWLCAGVIAIAPLCGHVITCALRVDVQLTYAWASHPSTTDEAVLALCEGMAGRAVSRRMQRLWLAVVFALRACKRCAAAAFVCVCVCVCV